jgi:hypothetical protein
MQFLILAALLIAADTPEAAGDRAYWLVGNWHCETRAGSRTTQTYSKVSNEPAINMTNVVRLPNNLYAVLRERYEFDSASNNWALDVPRNALWGAMHATAQPWLGKEWVFSGTGALPRPSGYLSSEQPLRMIYTQLGVDSFHRAHQERVDADWRTYSEETCRRDSTPQTSPTLQ